MEARSWARRLASWPAPCRLPLVSPGGPQFCAVTSIPASTAARLWCLALDLEEAESRWGARRHPEKCDAGLRAHAEARETGCRLRLGPTCPRPREPSSLSLVPSSLDLVFASFPFLTVLGISPSLTLSPFSLLLRMRMIKVPGVERFTHVVLFTPLGDQRGSVTRILLMKRQTGTGPRSRPTPSLDSRAPCSPTSQLDAVGPRGWRSH